VKGDALVPNPTRPRPRAQVVEVRARLQRTLGRPFPLEEVSTLTLAKLRELEKESGLTGSGGGGAAAAKPAAAADDGPDPGEEASTSAPAAAAPAPAKAGGSGGGGVTALTAAGGLGAAAAAAMGGGGGGKAAALKALKEPLLGVRALARLLS